MVATINPYTGILTAHKEFPTITLCGSMRFYPEILEAAAMLSRAGAIVLAPFCAFKPGEEQLGADKLMLDRMHFAKIDMSSAILIIAKDGYIGESTERERVYARKTGKGVWVEYYDNGHFDYDFFTRIVAVERDRVA